MNANATFAKLRDQVPLVHCITNYVAMNIAANVTLAAGASPAMIHAEEEVADFSPIAGALTINIGTLSTPWMRAMKNAAIAANDANIPWILDPIAHFATPYRTRAARDLLALKPSVVRGNASEIIALSGQAGSGKGADSGDKVEDAKAAAEMLALKHGCVVAVSGQVDYITDGEQRAHITGGSALMPSVTALGCSLTALVGAYCAIAPRLEAAVGAFLLFAEAGERAEAHAAGPGSFCVAFLDCLHNLQPGDLNEERISWG